MSAAAAEALSVFPREQQQQLRWRETVPRSGGMHPAAFRYSPQTLHLSDLLVTLVSEKICSSGPF